MTADRVGSIIRNSNGFIRVLPMEIQVGSISMKWVGHGRNRSFTHGSIFRNWRIGGIMKENAGFTRSKRKAGKQETSCPNGCIKLNHDRRKTPSGRNPIQPQEQRKRLTRTRPNRFLFSFPFLRDRADRSRPGVVTWRVPPPVFPQRQPRVIGLSIGREMGSPMPMPPPPL